VTATNRTGHPVIRWIENGEETSARWRSESGLPPPAKVIVGDDRISADAAFRLARAGTALLWRGDFHNARQLLQALAVADRDQPVSRAMKDVDGAFDQGDPFIGAQVVA